MSAVEGAAVATSPKYNRYINRTRPSLRGEQSSNLTMRSSVGGSLRSPQIGGVQRGGEGETGGWGWVKR